MNKKKFKKRYVLGEGYPWAFGENLPYKQIGLCSKHIGTQLVSVDFPLELWSNELPRYRLVLERIDKGA
jgi:hypothetical protein